jgi:hypothetical protein
MAGRPDYDTSAVHNLFMGAGYRKLMTQGGEVDRWLLSGLERGASEEAAQDLVRRLTDDVVEGAVRRLPPEWYAIDGPGLAAALEKRREGLVEASLEYYRRLARKVDVQGTDLGDRARVVRREDGGMEVALVTSRTADDPQRDGPASRPLGHDLVRPAVTRSGGSRTRKSGGLSFRFRDNRFTLGASWAWGGKDRPLDSPVPPKDVPEAGLGRDVSIRYSKITFLLGFVFGS